VVAKRRLEYSFAAGDDLESIQRYIAADNPKAAAQVIENIMAAADSLIDISNVGQTMAAGRNTQAGSEEISLLNHLSTHACCGVCLDRCASIAQTYGE
jgi:plasmid stabilization system protein ParE